MRVLEQGVSLTSAVHPGDMKSIDALADALAGDVKAPG